MSIVFRFPPLLIVSIHSCVISCFKSYNIICIPGTKYVQNCPCLAQRRPFLFRLQAFPRPLGQRRTHGGRVYTTVRAWGPGPGSVVRASGRSTVGRVDHGFPSRGARANQAHGHPQDVGEKQCKKRLSALLLCVSIVYSRKVTHQSSHALYVQRRSTRISSFPFLLDEDRRVLSACE